MPLKPQPCYTVPEDTAWVVRAILPKGNLYVRTHDLFSPLCEDEDFSSLFALDGQPSLSPMQLALVLVL